MNDNLKAFLKNIHCNRWSIELAVNFFMKFRHHPEVSPILRHIWEESLTYYSQWTDPRKMLYVFLEHELSILEDLDLDSRRG